jgi:hypothetical protein
MDGRPREPGKLVYRVAIAILLILGILSLPSIGWLLIVVALILALYGGLGSKRAVIAPISAGLLALIAAYVLFAPGFCTSGAALGPGGNATGTETSCVSLAQVPLGGGQNWIPFVVLGPLLAIATAVLIHRSRSRRLPAHQTG